jgi:hypothetical protein
MRLSRILLLTLIGCAMVMSAVAQDQTQARRRASLWLLRRFNLRRRVRLR